jgi:hypothetical protein
VETDVSRRSPLVVATVLSMGLALVYVALGGGRYEPMSVADPCQTREWRDPGGLQEVLEQVVLSGLDGAACELGVSREELVLALRDEAALDRFAARNGISSADAERAIATALARAIDDAEDAGALPGLVAGVVRSVTENLPPHLLLELVDRLRGVLT